MKTSDIIDYLIEKGELIDTTLQEKVAALFNDKYFDYDDKREKISSLLSVKKTKNFRNAITTKKN